MEVWEDKEEAVPRLPTPILDRSISYGAILQMIPTIALFLTTIGLVFKFQFETEEGLRQAKQFQDDTAPVIKGLSVNDIQQDMKIQQVQDAIGEIRTLARIQTEQMSNMNTSIAVIKNTLEKEKDK